jgi:hypothetical protein
MSARWHVAFYALMLAAFLLAMLSIRDGWWKRASLLATLGLALFSFVLLYDAIVVAW